MQFLLLLFKIIFAAYIAAWLILLILCLRKKEFWPIAGDFKITKYFWLMTFVFLNPVLSALYFFFGQIRLPCAKPNKFALPIVLAFVIAGFYINFPGITHLWMQPLSGRSVNESGRRFHASLAAIKSVDNTNTTSVVHNSDNSRLACRSVAIFCENDHILLKCVANHLRSFVEKIPNVDTVKYYNPESTLPEPGLSPDIFIRLDLNHFKENFLPYYLKLEAEIHASISNQAVSGGSGYINHRTPPVLDYSLNVDLTHKSKTTGYESVRYDMAAKEIAKQINSELEKNLKNWQEKHGLLPAIPKDFYGEYKPSELPEPFKSFKVKKLYSYSGLMKYNETIWQIDITGDAVEKLRQMRQQMIELGWKGLNYNFDEQTLEMRPEKDNRSLHIFKPQDTDAFRHGAIVTNIQKDDKEKSTRLYICDVESLPDEELYLALDKLLDEPVDMELVMLFERMFNPVQQEKYFELLKSRPPSSLYSQVRLAEIYQGKQMFEQARQTLLRAAAMLLTTRDQSTFKNRLTDLAKKLGDEKLVDKQPDRELLLDMGFIEITKDTQPFKIEAEQNEQVILFSQNSDGKTQTLCMSCAPTEKSTNPLKPFSLSYTHYSGFSTGWGTQGGTYGNNTWEVSHFQPDFIEGYSLGCSFTKNKDNNKYIMSFEIHKQAGR